MDIEVNGYKLLGLSKINVIMGKNGCGKSTLLKAVEGVLLDQGAGFGTTKYITPERGGALVYEAGIEQQHTSDANYLRSNRRANQSPQFRQQTIAQYRSLETSILRAVEASAEAGKRKHPQFFSQILVEVNALLDNIQIERDSGGGPVFKIISKVTKTPVDAAVISSGEAELISLAIESLTFAANIVAGQRNVLFLDEPDVHLHPDLQARLTQFIVGLVEQHDFEVIIATHSTPLLGELSEYQHSRVALMSAGDKELSFEPIDEEYRQILPVFGAHPLSNIFNSTPILLVEGEDDVRIWQQAVRSSQGRIRLYPVECGSIDKVNDYETKVIKIANAVYDKPLAYSLRDRDGVEEDIDDLLPIVRMRLACRTAENLLLSDDVLAAENLDWEGFKVRAEKWLSDNPDHEKYQPFMDFKTGGFERKTAKLKELRVLIVAIMGGDKPWEVLVGQVIAGQQQSSSPASNSIQDYLGSKIVENLLAI